MIDRSVAEHYTWGQSCDGWHLVKNISLSVIQERMPPHTFEVRHKHITSCQFFFVLSGHVTIECEGKREVLQAHQGVEVPPGMPHQVFNESAHDLEFIVVSCPPSHADKIVV